MKNLFTILLLLFFVCPVVFSQIGLRSPGFVGNLNKNISSSSSSDVPSGTLVNEDFEGTGTPSGWTKSGSVNFDETGTVLDGSQSLSFDATSSGPYAYKAYTGQSSVTYFFDFQFHTAPGSTRRFIEFDTSGYSSLGYLGLTSSRKLNVEPVGGTQTQGSTVLSVDTHYRIWLKYTKGTGSNASLEVWISTTDSKSDAVDHILVSDGTATSDAALLWMEPQNGFGLMFIDRMRIDP
jgi:hypothetical protein